MASDTPSKALAQLAGLLAGPARRARADMAAAMREAERRLDAAGHALAAARQAVAAGAERRVHAAAVALAAAEVMVAAATAGAGERCARLGAEADRLHEAVRTRAAVRLDEAGRLTEHAVSDGLAAGRLRLERADDGRAALGAVLTRATARLDAAAAEATRRHEAVPLDAAQNDPICKARYKTLRARGHGHARALRSVADRLLGVACAMLKTGSIFDPNVTAKTAC